MPTCYGRRPSTTPSATVRPNSTTATPCTTTRRRSTWPRRKPFAERRSDFSPEGQQRLERAQLLLRVASDESATHDERRSAYAKARTELDGLVVLPAIARASIERRIVGEIEA